MSAANEKSTSELSQNLREKLSPLISEWQWEERFCALQGAFSSDKSEAVQAILNEYFAQTWTHKSLKKASEDTKKQAGAFASLSKTQCLYSESEATNLLAAWWPWGHGATVSVRLFEAYSTQWQEKRGLLTKLTSWFA